MDSIFLRYTLYDKTSLKEEYEDILDGDINSILETCIINEEFSTMALSKKIVGFVKDLYKKDEDELVKNQGNIVRTLLKLAISAALVLSGSAVLVILTAIGWWVDHVISSGITKEQTIALITKFQSELEIIDDKIKYLEGKEQKPSVIRSKHNLIKLRNIIKKKLELLEKNLKKLK